MVYSTPPRPYYVNLSAKTLQNLLSTAPLFAGGLSRSQDFSDAPKAFKLQVLLPSDTLQAISRPSSSRAHHHLFDLQACNSRIHLAAAPPDILSQPTAHHAICVAGTVSVFICFFSLCHSDIRVWLIVVPCKEWACGIQVRLYSSWHVINADQCSLALCNVPARHLDLFPALTNSPLAPMWLTSNALIVVAR
jgi:hypothetical protein